MPITFDEISGQVVPERAAESSAAPAAQSSAHSQDSVNELRRALHIERERERRLIAD